ncbi:hypothetical protein KFE98_01405 [bacterium SCSIO 12741]|nr:hypothetical protein KFE98_01405 [bacterium SCSIO 12741]
MSTNQNSMITPDQKITFELSMLSNISAYATNVDPKSIQAWTTAKTKQVLLEGEKYLGKWNLVWGPLVHVEKNAAANTMFMVQSNTSPNKFVIAIAGTNSQSVYDWKVEDCKVRATNMVKWTSVVDFKESHMDLGKISEGTHIGLNILLGLRDPETGYRLLDLIPSILRSGGEIQVTGHSLGGALSPTLALYLHDRFKNPASKDYSPGYRGVVSCMATAGPTPGGKKWADHYNQQLGYNSTRYWNVKDIVPHAWEERLLKEIPGLYEDFGIPKSDELIAATDYAKSLAVFGEYTQAQGDGHMLYHKAFPLEGKNACVQFLNQAVKQHTTAYIEIFDIGEYWRMVEVITHAKPYPPATSCSLVSRLAQKQKESAEA